MEFIWKHFVLSEQIKQIFSYKADLKNLQYVLFLKVNPAA